MITHMNGIHDGITEGDVTIFANVIPRQRFMTCFVIIAIGSVITIGPQGGTCQPRNLFRSCWTITFCFVQHVLFIGVLGLSRVQRIPVGGIRRQHQFSFNLVSFSFPSGFAWPGLGTCLGTRLGSGWHRWIPFVQLGQVQRSRWRVGDGKIWWSLRWFLGLIWRQGSQRIDWIERLTKVFGHQVSEIKSRNQLRSGCPRYWWTSATCGRTWNQRVGTGIDTFLQ